MNEIIAIISQPQEITAIIDPPREIVAVVEAKAVMTEGSSLNENELLKIYEQGKEDYNNGKTNTN